MAGRAGSDAVRARADAALLRATRSALAAEIQDQRALDAPAWLREVHESLAEVHRRTEARHETAAVLHLAYAYRLAAWEEGRDPALASRPSLLAGIVDVVGGESAITLNGPRDEPALTTTSGALALRAMQVEQALHEGPTHDCNAHHLAVPAQRPAGWTAYGMAPALIGVWSVAATPLIAAGRQFGVLTTFNTPAPDPRRRTISLASVAAAITETVLDVTPQTGSDLPEWAVLASPGEDVAAQVHCASGMVSELLGCDTDHALSIITAHAVATGQPAEAVARRILDTKGLPGGAQTQP